MISKRHYPIVGDDIRDGILCIKMKQSLTNVSIKKLSLTGLLLASMIFLPGAWAATFTVNTTADTTVPGGCTTASICSLRDAILAANLNSGSDNIEFDIPGPGKHTITPVLPIAPSTTFLGLPDITDPVNIDATTQPGFTDEPVIELSGSGGAVNGISLIFHRGSEVNGFILNSFLDPTGQTFNLAVLIFEGGSHTITGNWFGTDATGTSSKPNKASILVISSEDNQIGGETPAERNIISGNSDGTLDRFFGIILDSSDHNRIEGNWLGLDKTGLVALPNNGEGILFFNSHSNVIGGSEAKRNIISATLAQQAIQSEGSSANTISNNCFGTDKDCDIENLAPPFANGSVSPHDTIVLLNLDPNFSADNNLVEHNVIAQNAFSGIQVASGNLGIPLQDTGLATNMSNNGTIIRGNTIIDSDDSGIALFAINFAPALLNQLDPPASVKDTLITDNTIINSGTSAVYLQSADFNFDAFPNHANQPPTIENTTITGNSMDGATFGLYMESHVTNTHVEANTIGNTFVALMKRNNVANSKILNNTIGLNAMNVPLPNTFGIFIGPIDYLDPGANFLFTNSPRNPSSNHLIEGNTIANNGTPILIGSDIDQYINATGTFDPGIVPDSIDASSQNITIINNAIYNNSGIGIDLSTLAILDPAFAVISPFIGVVTEAITAVTDGVTENDPDNQNDADEGANGLQNFPKVTKAKYKDDEIVIHASLQSEGDETYVLHFYLNDTDAREGRIPVGEGAIVHTEANGKGEIKVERPIPPGAVEGMYMTATATKVCLVDVDACPDGLAGTSEFSEARKVQSQLENDDDDSSDSEGSSRSSDSGD